MVNSIGSGGMMPNPQDLFKKVDADGSGGISQAELKIMSEKVKEKTGQTFDVSKEAFKGYDADSNGSLSGEELKSVMENSGFGPNRGIHEGMGPPPTQQGLYAYNSSSSSSSTQEVLSSIIDELMTILDKLSSSSDSTDSTTADSNSLQARRRHNPQDVFEEIDSDSSGAISQDEMKILAESFKNITGQTVDVSDEAFKGYDSDGDNALNADELKSAMETNGFKPPQGPQPDIMRAQSDSHDQIAELQNLLKTLSKHVQSGTSNSEPLLSVTT